jgi:hypothetical protein
MLLIISLKRGYKMNTNIYYPAGWIDPTDTGEIYERACEHFKTDNPTKEQQKEMEEMLNEEAEASLENAYDAWREEGLI